MNSKFQPILLLLLATSAFVLMVGSTGPCQQWLSKEDLKPNVRIGDIIGIHDPSNGVQQRTVIHVGNGRVMHSDGQKFVLGNLEDVMGTTGEGCVNNTFDGILGANPDTDEIVKKALAQAGQADSGANEEQLANFARYGHHNSTWIENALNGSSLVLQDQIRSSSLKVKGLIDNMFGRFTKMLVDKAMDSLKASSAHLAGGSGGNSLGSSLGGR